MCRTPGWFASGTSITTRRQRGPTALNITFMPRRTVGLSERGSYTGSGAGGNEVPADRLVEVRDELLLVAADSGVREHGRVQSVLEFLQIREVLVQDRAEGAPSLLWIAGVRDLDRGERLRLTLRESPCSAPRRCSSAATALLDAAERLIDREGLASLTTRRVARQADLNPGLVFASIDDLCVAVMRRTFASLMDQQRRIFATDHPFAEQWRLATRPLRGGADRRRMKVWSEFAVAATNRPVLAAEMLLSSPQRSARVRSRSARPLKSKHSLVRLLWWPMWTPLDCSTSPSGSC
jgi:AcrR family transcriptional regulator